MEEIVMNVGDCRRKYQQSREITGISERHQQMLRKTSEVERSPVVEGGSSLFPSPLSSPCDLELLKNFRVT